jgi:hypothetical protein
MLGADRKFSTHLWNDEIDPTTASGAFALRRLGLLTPGAEGLAPWVSRVGTGTADMHVSCQGEGVLIDGHYVSLEYLPAFNCRPACRPQFRCPACDRRCGRLYKVPQASYPWRCVRCAGLKYRAKHLGPVDRAERRLVRLSSEGRERKPHEKRGRYYRRLSRILAAEQKLANVIAQFLDKPQRQK